MNQVTVLGICTLPLLDNRIVVVSPAFIHQRDVRTPDKKLDSVMVPMEDLRGTPAEVRKRAHELVDKALDDWEEYNLQGEVPEGTIGVWSEREEKHP